MKFPGRSQLSDPYADIVRGENLTAAEAPKRLEAQRLKNAQKLAVARYWLEEVALEDVSAIGASGRRFRVAGTEYRLSEELFQDHEDPREAGVELFFVDAAGVVQYLRKPRGVDSGVGLDSAIRSGEVRGNMLLTADGKARRLGR